MGQRAALRVLFALCTLLLAGGLPWGGAEEVYRCGFMQVLGGGIGVMCLCAARRLSRGESARFAAGAVCLFFALAGVGIALKFGGKTYTFARMGGGMWFGAVGTACSALIGLCFIAVFGYLGYLCMRVKKLWVAGMHLCLVVLLIGAFVDFYCEQRIPLVCAADAPDSFTGDPKLPFSVSVKHLDIIRYNDTDTYILMVHRAGKWHAEARGTRDGSRIRFGDESRQLSELHRINGGNNRFYAIPGYPPRILVQQMPPVREYRAVCSLRIPQGKIEEADIRVNEPAEWEGYKIYLMNCSADGRRVQLPARRAPGDVWVRSGAIGFLLCSCGWFFSRGAKKIS